MAITPVPINLRIDERALQAGALQAIAQHLTQALSPAYQAAVQSRAAQEALTRIRVSPEYASLHGGVLQAQLGLVAPTTQVEGVLQGLADGCRCDVVPPRVAGASLTGSVVVGILREDLSDVLSRPEASFVSENGHDVEWLRWLLTEGDRLIIADYGFLPASRMRPEAVAKFSRTRLGIMRKKGTWGVPAEFAGSRGANWLTRALNLFEQVLGKILVEELQRRL